MSIYEISQAISYDSLVVPQPVGHTDGYFKDIFCENINIAQPVVIATVPPGDANIPAFPAIQNGEWQPVSYNSVTNQLAYSNRMPFRFVSVSTPPDDYTTFVEIKDADGNSFNESRWTTPILCSFDNNTGGNANATYAIRYGVLPNGNRTVNYYNNADSGTICYVQLMLIDKRFAGFERPD